MQISRPNQMQKQTRSKEETTWGGKNPNPSNSLVLVASHPRDLAASTATFLKMSPARPSTGGRWAPGPPLRVGSDPRLLAVGCRWRLVTAAEGPHATTSSPQDDDSNDAPQLASAVPARGSYLLLHSCFESERNQGRRERTVSEVGKVLKQSAVDEVDEDESWGDKVVVGSTMHRKRESSDFSLCAHRNVPTVFKFS